MFTETTGRVLIITSSVLLLMLVHFAVGTQTHQLHIIHVVLGVVGLMPILLGAVWFAVEGGAASAALVSALYYAHMRLSWPNQPMENANQAGMIVTYLFVGLAAGLLVRLQDAERNRRLKAEQSAQREAIVQGFAGLASALGSRDDYTLKHSENVAKLSMELGRRRGLSPERVELLRLAALVHDIGKIGVRDDILLKPGRLNEAETAEMRRHPAVAAEILRAIGGTEEIAKIVLAHHERLNGTGYPAGLKDNQIPLEAKVLSVADIYCALTEQRAYRSALMDSAGAMAIIGPMAARELDALTVELLRGLLAENRVERGIFVDADAGRLSANGHDFNLDRKNEEAPTAPPTAIASASA